MGNVPVVSLVNPFTPSVPGPVYTDAGGNYNMTGIFQITNVNAYGSLNCSGSTCSPVVMESPNSSVTIAARDGLYWDGMGVQVNISDGGTNSGVTLSTTLTCYNVFGHVVDGFGNPVQSIEVFGDNSWWGAWSQYDGSYATCSPPLGRGPGNPGTVGANIPQQMAYIGASQLTFNSSTPPQMTISIPPDPGAGLRQDFTLTQAPTGGNGL
jgi:hypothetical protein